MSFIDDYKRVVLSLTRGKSGSRMILEKALEMLDQDEKPFYVIRAPTGYGKTAFSLTLAVHAMKDASRFEKVIHILPMRSIIEDIYERASSLFPHHVGRQMMGVHEDPFLLRPFTLTTVDTFTYDFLKLNTVKMRAVREGKEYGYDYLTQASIALSAVVFDEAHSILEDRIMASAFLTVLDGLLRLGVPLFLMTATMSRSYAKILKRKAERGEYSFRVVPDFNETVEDDFFRRERRKKFKIELRADMPEKLLKEGKRNLIVLNTVIKAQQTYLTLKEEGYDPLLLHSRFTRHDRERLMKELEGLKNRKEWVIVATQVVEAGIDISSDVLITELAPPTSLIQRMGRNARFDELEGEIYVLKRENCPPYNEEICRRTLKWLIEGKNLANMHPRDPFTYQGLLDTVYRLVAQPYGKLMTYVLNPMIRSDEMMGALDEITRRQDFLREYPVSLMVGKASVPVPRELLEWLVRRMPGSVIIRYENVEKIAEKPADVRKAVRDLVFWKNVEISLRDDLVESMYNREVGLKIELSGI